MFRKTLLWLLGSVIFLWYGFLPAFSPTSTQNPNRGRYRVVINGFTVNNPTWDHALEIDGKGDEVYFSVIVQTLDKEGNQLSYSEPKTKTMGDINQFPERVKAGSRSDKGGLNRGDTFPTNTPWVMSQSPQPDRPPWLVWEGELIEGETAVIIMPSIYEWDGAKDAFNEWIQWAKTTFEKLKPFLNVIFGPQSVIVCEGIQLGLNVATSMGEPGFWGEAKDRPIGMRKEGGRYNFIPKVVTLTYEKAEWLQNNNPSGKGNGILELRYIDDPKLAGDYSFYIQVQRIQPAPPEKPVLLSPPSGSTVGTHIPTLDWEDATGASEYQIQISPSETFTTLIVDTTVVSSSYTPTSDLNEGLYFWRVRAINAGGTSEWSSSWSFRVYIENTNPVASAGGPYMGQVGIPLTFDGSASIDLDGDTLTYNWDFGDGNTGTGMVVQHIYTSAGTYTVTLRVDDSRGGWDTDTTIAEIPQVEGNEIISDNYTVLLEHFNETTSANNIYPSGDLVFIESVYGLNQALDCMSRPVTLRYDLPVWYQSTWEGASPSPQGSVEAWIQIHNYDPKLILVFQWYKADVPPGYGGWIGILRVLPEGKLRWESWGSVGTTVAHLDGKTTIPLNQWTYVALTWGAEGTKLYINGKKDTSITENLYPAMGWYGDPEVYVYLGGEFGYLDEVHVSKIQRSDEEIRAHYQLMSNIVLLENFDGVTVANNIYPPGELIFVQSLAGLNQALDCMSRPVTLRYDLPVWYQSTWEGASPSPQGSVEAWIQIHNYDPKLILVFQWYKADVPPGYGGWIGILRVLPEGKLRWESWGSVGTTVAHLDGKTTIPLNQWTYVALTWGAEGTKLYVNGKKDTSITENLYPAMGWYGDPEVYIYLGGESGYLDEVRIFKIQRSDMDIMGYYQFITEVKSPDYTISPSSYLLHQNYPNPFNTMTNIRYQLPKASHVKLRIFNILGQEVRRLVDAEQVAGCYTLQWDGKNDAGFPMASGVYLLRMETGNFVQTKKLLLIH